MSALVGEAVTVGAGGEGVEETAMAGEEGGVGWDLAGIFEGEGGGGKSPSCPERALWVWQFRHSHSFCKTISKQTNMSMTADKIMRYFTK